MTAIGVDRGHVRTAHAIVFEFLVERFDPHRPDAFRDQIANGIIHHRARDAGVEPEAVGEIGGNVEFAATDVDVAVRRLAERDDAGVKPVDESAEGQEIQIAIGADIQTILHSFLPVRGLVELWPGWTNIANTDGCAFRMLRAEI